MNADRRFKEFRGREAGPMSVIMAGVHGNEEGTNNSMLRLLSRLEDGLQLDRGIIVLGFANPPAIAQNVRAVGVDMNRITGLSTAGQRNTYEYRRFHRYIRPHLDRSTGLLDLHGYNSEEGVPYLIGDQRLDGAIMHKLPFAYAVSGLDSIQPGGTDHYMHRNNKIGICAESGPNKDPGTIEVGIETALTFMKARGHLRFTGALPDHEQALFEAYYQHLAETKFIREQKWKEFQEVEAGTIIGRDGGVIFEAPKKSALLFIGKDVNQGEEAFVLAQRLRAA